MRMPRGAVRAALIATPLVAFLLYAALNWVRFEESSRWVQMGPEAQRDPYLAYTRVLKKLGTTFRASDKPSSLETAPEGSVVFLASRRLVYMTNERIAKIVGWVERGGTLVVEAEPPSIDDPLIEAFGIDRDRPDPADEARKSMRARPPARKSTVTTFDWDASGTPLRVDFGRFAVPLFQARAHGDHVAARLDKDVVAIAFPQKAGRVVVLGSFAFLRNTAIGELDHAELGWQLASHKPGGVLLFLKPPQAALGEWLLEEAWPVLIAAALVLMIWLVRVIPRFGPLAPADTPPRRRLGEHIAATGRFLWSRGESAFLMQAARERVWRAASRRLSRVDAAEPMAAIEKVSESAATSKAKAHRALIGPAESEPAFVAAASALQEIEANLGRRRAPKLSKKGIA
jgi:hypothetical protein